MYTLPKNFQQKIDQFFDNHSVKIPKGNFLKWANYYWDFCQRYSLNELLDKSISSYIESLVLRKKNSRNINEARASVTTLLGIIKPEIIKRNNAYEPTWSECYDKLKRLISLKQYSKKTLKSYTVRIKQFQGYVENKDPGKLNLKDAENFLTWLTVDQKVSTSTQNLAFNALLFLYKQVLKKNYSGLKHIPFPKVKAKIPTVLSRSEVDILLKKLPEKHRLFFSLIYACGLRLNEALTLRIHNFNFEEWVLTVQSGKGDKARMVPLPHSLTNEIAAHFESLKELHKSDLLANVGGVELPKALHKKYKNAGRELAWQWFFPSKSLYFDKEKNLYCRYHLHVTAIQKVIKKAALQSGIPKRISTHTLRHSYATHLLQNNFDIRTIQELMGHSNIQTTMIYTHAVKAFTNRQPLSPLDIN